MQGFLFALAMLDVYGAAFFIIRVCARNPRESGLYISVVSKTVQLLQIGSIILYRPCRATLTYLLTFANDLQLTTLTSIVALARD